MSINSVHSMGNLTSDHSMLNHLGMNGHHQHMITGHSIPAHHVPVGNGGHIPAMGLSYGPIPGDEYRNSIGMGACVQDLDHLSSQMQQGQSNPHLHHLHP